MTQICVESMRIGLGNFKATAEQEATVRLAVRNYGHLIGSVQRKLISFDEFASIIERHYDISTPQTAEVVRVLRLVHTLNVPAESELPKDVVIGGIFCGTEISTNLFAEEVASSRWVIRYRESADFAKRIGEVMGGLGRYQAMLMRGDHVGVKPTLLAAAQLLRQ